jgi:uncharacterized protein YdeI (YjbR/CyaY-like superfamily)
MDIPSHTRAGKSPGVRIPDELRDAFLLDEAAWNLFDKMPPSHQRETVDYVAEAKKPETRVKRAQSVMLALKTGKIGTANK